MIIESQHSEVLPELRLVEARDPRGRWTLAWGHSSYRVRATADDWEAHAQTVLALVDRMRQLEAQEGMDPLPCEGSAMPSNSDVIELRTFGARYSHPAGGDAS